MAELLRKHDVTNVTDDIYSQCVATIRKRIFRSVARNEICVITCFNVLILKRFKRWVVGCKKGSLFYFLMAGYLR